MIENILFWPKIYTSSPQIVAGQLHWKTLPTTTLFFDIRIIKYKFIAKFSFIVIHLCAYQWHNRFGIHHNFQA